MMRRVLSLTLRFAISQMRLSNMVAGAVALACVWAGYEGSLLPLLIAAVCFVAVSFCFDVFNLPLLVSDACRAVRWLKARTVTGTAGTNAETTRRAIAFLETRRLAAARWFLFVTILCIYTAGLTILGRWASTLRISNDETFCHVIVDISGNADKDTESILDAWIAYLKRDLATGEQFYGRDGTRYLKELLHSSQTSETRKRLSARLLHHKEEYDARFRFARDSLKTAMRMKRRGLFVTAVAELGNCRGNLTHCFFYATTASELERRLREGAKQYFPQWWPDLAGSRTVQEFEWNVLLGYWSSLSDWYVADYRYGSPDGSDPAFDAAGHLAQWEAANWVALIRDVRAARGTLPDQVDFTNWIKRYPDSKLQEIQGKLKALSELECFPVEGKTELRSQDAVIRKLRQEREDVFLSFGYAIGALERVIVLKSWLEQVSTVQLAEQALKAVESAEGKIEHLRKLGGDAALSEYAIAGGGDYATGHCTIFTQTQLKRAQHTHPQVSFSVSKLRPYKGQQEYPSHHLFVWVVPAGRPPWLDWVEMEWKTPSHSWKRRVFRVWNGEGKPNHFDLVNQVSVRLRLKGTTDWGPTVFFDGKPKECEYKITHRLPLTRTQYCEEIAAASVAEELADQMAAFLKRGTDPKRRVEIEQRVVHIALSGDQTIKQVEITRIGNPRNDMAATYCYDGWKGKKCLTHRLLIDGKEMHIRSLARWEDKETYLLPVQIPPNRVITIREEFDYKIEPIVDRSLFPFERGSIVFPRCWVGERQIDRFNVRVDIPGYILDESSGSYRVKTLLVDEYGRPSVEDTNFEQAARFRTESDSFDLTDTFDWPYGKEVRIIVRRQGLQLYYLLGLLSFLVILYLSGLYWYQWHRGARELRFTPQSLRSLATWLRPLPFIPHQFIPQQLVLYYRPMKKKRALTIIPLTALSLVQAIWAISLGLFQPLLAIWWNVPPCPEGSSLFYWWPLVSIAPIAAGIIVALCLSLVGFAILALPRRVARSIQAHYS